MKPLTAVFILLLFCTGMAFGQYDMLSTEVTFQYDRVRIKEALDDISDNYNVKFSYSSSVVNVRHRVSANVENVPLSIGLDELFEKTPIVYSRIGQHIVLRNNPDKRLSKTKPEKMKPPIIEEPAEEPPVVLVKTEEPEPEMELRPAPDSVISLEMPKTRPVNRDGEMYPFDRTLLNFEKWRTEVEYKMKPADNKRLAQVSLLPSMGTNTGNSPNMINNVSMNLLWGESGGVDGLELGTIMNTVNKDVKGIQMAGFGNRVGRNVTGTQVGGIFNKNDGMTRGLQAAGIINLTNHVQAAQAAGAVNWADGNVAGLQASGLLNRAGGDAQALQAAGLINISKGRTKAQVGGLFNKAGDVEILQIGGLMNVSTGHVKGLQVGLINISDTVSGVPIALINIVKRGYNKVEIYGSEILHGNIQFKLGANRFYNIFHIGAQVPPGDGSYIWGLGYGIGTMTKVTPKTHFNFELMAIHISENESWTNTLNSIGQFRFLWNHQIGRSIGFFLGPTFNMMVSQLRNAETGEIKSPVVPYTLIDEDLDSKTNLKAWVGVNAGFRF